jgi:UDP-N-acetylmuramate: L-alanyl-gamma-D-glutamyl-meso-diaminopimelate ligase
MTIHFIAIGGSAMHNLAIALHLKEVTVTGSDDEIFEPSRSRLAAYGLLPATSGWDEKRIHAGLDAVVLGMHAHADNPELVKAKKLKLKIYSYPEFLYEHSKNKKRVVIGGSHGKTTITALILHVLKHHAVAFDYMVGAQLDDFDVMVRLSDEAPVMVLEGDEYLTSALDLRPKFHVYHPDIALISGIAWDHMNVFPTFEDYKEQFRTFIGLIPAGGTLVYCEDDETVRELCRGIRNDITIIPYSVPAFKNEDGITYLRYGEGDFPLKIFGRHNLLNISGARVICNLLGVSDGMFYEAVTTFQGASKRLELVAAGPQTAVYRDFAHAPSKLEATTRALKEQYPGRHLVACMELHTYSSLNSAFLPQYRDTMRFADTAFVYFNPHVLALKRLPPLSQEMVRTAFNHGHIRVFISSQEMVHALESLSWHHTNLLMMTSGDFDGLDVKVLAGKVVALAGSGL